MKISKVNKTIVDKTRKSTSVVSMGGDPEFFIADKRGKVLNADAFLPGKHNSHIVRSDGDRFKGKVFFDGIQAEMAVAHNTCREYFAVNTRACWRHVLRTIPEDHKIVLKPAVKVQKAILERADPEARRFGCAPDFNAYTLSANTPEMDASRHPFRYAGGHMHLGGYELKYKRSDDPYVKAFTTEEGHLRMIKLLDFLVTIPTLLLDSGPGAKKRRAKYGKAGCFRPTPYGIEYRTPSCWWLKSPMTLSLVYGLGKLAVLFLAADTEEDFRKEINVDEETIRGCIDESDTKTASGIWKNLRPYIALIGRSYSNPLNMGSLFSTDRRYYADSRYVGYNGPPKTTGRVVHALACFEYMLKNGLDAVIGNNVRNEWALPIGFGLPNGPVWRNGFVSGAFNKLIGNEDFEKFQTSFLKELYT